MSDFNEAAKVWAARHPAVVAYTTNLVERGVNAAVFSSVVRAIAGIAIDARPYPQGDIDLLVPRRQLTAAAAALPSVVSDSHKLVRTWGTDGTVLRFAAREITGMAGDDEIQFVAPHTPLIGRGHRYNTRYTPADYGAATIIETNEGLLPVAHPANTVGMYGILQRPKGETDAGKLAVVLAATDVLTDPYTPVCAERMGWDDRVWQFVERAGEQATAQIYRANMSEHMDV
jgi:hypothetical protein